MPDHDAFGREVDPAAEPGARPQAEARPAKGQAAPPPAPRRRRNARVAVPLALAVLSLGVLGVFLLVSGASLGGGGNALSDLGSTDGSEEFDETLAQLEPDPDAPSALTAEGSEDALAAIRDEEADGPPRLVLFQPDYTAAVLRIRGRDFTMTVARGQTVTNGWRTKDPVPRKARPIAWEDVDTAVLDRVVEAAGGTDAVDSASLTAPRGELEWTVTLADESKRRFDGAGAPIS